MGNTVNGYKGLTRLTRADGFRYRIIPAENLGEREDHGWEIDAETDPSFGPVYYRIRKPEDKPAPVEEPSMPPTELEVLRAKLEVLTRKVEEQAEIIDILTTEPEQKPETDDLDKALADEN